MSLYPMTLDDCRTVVDLLERAGRAADVLLAEKIKWVLDHQSNVLELTSPERESLLAVLDDPPESLVELSGALLRDRRDRPS
jgi:hypothetical protein